MSEFGAIQPGSSETSTHELVRACVDEIARIGRATQQLGIDCAVSDIASQGESELASALQSVLSRLPAERRIALATDLAALARALDPDADAIPTPSPSGLLAARATQCGRPTPNGSLPSVPATPRFRPRLRP